MQDSIAISLPPLRRKILRSFIAVVGLYGLLGVLFLAAFFFASGVTPNILHANYDSIHAARQMREALDGLRNPADYPQKSQRDWVAEFESALRCEEGNVTEIGETQVARTLRRDWNESKTNLARMGTDAYRPTYIAIQRNLSELIAINERAMFRAAEMAARIRHRILFAAGFIFLGTLCIAFYLADGLAIRVSDPIKAIAEALRNKPVPGEKLRLPTPTSLEIRILTFEMNQLWKRLSELRKLNIEEISQQRSKLEIVLEAVEDGIVVIDNTDTVLQCSQGLLKIIGLSPEAVIGQKWHDLPTGDADYLALREKLTTSLRENESIGLEVGHETRTFGLRCRKITSKEGDIAATLYLLHDITERKQRERLKSEFIAVLSHELKTPLQSLGTASELLMKRRGEWGDEEKMLIETIHEDVARIRAVAQDFMQVSFVDPHSLRLIVSKYAISELVQEWVKPFRVVARDKQVTIECVKRGSDVIWANIDSVKFPWAVSNLLSNAVRFSPPDSKVTVETTDTNGGVAIEIRDEGPGIPTDLTKRMFDPYFQGGGDASTPSGFLGLGLTIAKEVVEAHKGTLEYYPGKPRGSIFRITLPRMEGKA